MSHAELFTGTASANSRATPRDLVDAFQRDLLRLAFALTGSEAVALYLTRDVLLDVLTGMDLDDEEVDPQSWSLLQIALGRRYMQGADPEGGPDGTDDDQRARLRETIELLSRPMRTALVLRDLGGLNERDVAAITGIDIEELDGVLDWSRARLREAGGRFTGQPPARLLASLAVDAPQRDLWPEVGPVIEEHESLHKRRNRRLLAGALAVLLAFGLGTVIWFLGDVPFVGGSEPNDAPDNNIAITGDPPPTRPPLPTATPAPTPTSVELIDAALGSDLLIHGNLLDENSRGTGEQVMFAFDPRAEEPLIEAGTMSAYPTWSVSPDGRWTVLFRERYEENVETDVPGDYTRTRTFSAILDGEEMGWEYELPASVGGWDSAIVGDRLYILSSTPEPATMRALDLESGEVVETRTLEIPGLGLEFRAGFIPPPEGSWRINTSLFVAPDAADPTLYSFITLSQYGDDIRNKWTRWVYRIDPDDLRPRFLNTDSVTAAEESGENDVANPAFPLWDPKMMPDGTGLYRHEADGQQLEITVLDFETGDVESFSTSFTNVIRTESNRTYLHTINSNVGRKLYVLSDLTGEIAIVDLAGRRVERTFALDLAGLTRGPIESSNHHLSHDGRYLYIVQDMTSYSQSGLVESHPVWVVDLTTWRVEEQLNVPGYIQSLYPDPDGRSLYAVTHAGSASDPVRERYQLLTYDTEDWEITARQELSDLIDQPATFRLQSISDTYRDTYGRAPVIDGIEPEDIEDYTTLPRARIVTDEERIPVGATRAVELEFLDPATGEPLTGADPRIRYDPDEPVTLVFEQPGAKSLISVAAELGPGHERGTIRLKEPGLWDARIVTGDEESGFTLILNDVLRGTSTLEADDGNSYDLRLETEPDVLLPDSEIVVRAIFVNAETGEPLPEDVTLIDGLPEALRISLIGVGAVNRNLDAAEHGVYETTITLPGPASFWSATLIFRQPESEETRSTQIEMGILEVVEAPPP